MQNERESVPSTETEAPSDPCKQSDKYLDLTTPISLRNPKRHRTHQVNLREENQFRRTRGPVHLLKQRLRLPPDFSQFILLLGMVSHVLRPCLPDLDSLPTLPLCSSADAVPFVRLSLVAVCSVWFALCLLVLCLCNSFLALLSAVLPSPLASQRLLRFEMSSLVCFTNFVPPALSQHVFLLPREWSCECLRFQCPPSHQPCKSLLFCIQLRHAIFRLHIFHRRSDSPAPLFLRDLGSGRVLTHFFFTKLSNQTVDWKASLRQLIIWS